MEVLLDGGGGVSSTKLTTTEQKKIAIKAKGDALGLEIDIDCTSLDQDLLKTIADLKTAKNEFIANIDQCLQGKAGDVCKNKLEDLSAPPLSNPHTGASHGG